MEQVKTGLIAGTGADLSVELGFTPRYVKVINRTALAAGAGGLVGLEWFEGMEDDEAIGINAVADSGATGDFSLTDMNADGITIIDDASVHHATDPVTISGYHGFQIAAAFHADADVLFYLALR